MKKIIMINFVPIENLDISPLLLFHQVCFLNNLIRKMKMNYCDNMTHWIKVYKKNERYLDVEIYEDFNLKENLI